MFFIPKIQQVLKAVTKQKTFNTANEQKGLSTK